jgi:hypothetical protein
MNPGAMTLTQIPNGVRSLAMVRVRLSTAVLDAVYAVTRGGPNNAAIEVILMITPVFLVSRYFPTSSDRANTPLRLV